LLYWTALPAATVPNEFARSLFGDAMSRDPRKGIVEALGSKRLISEPSEILREFSTVRPGTLNVYNQLFWPVHRQKSELRELTELSNSAFFSVQNPEIQFRARILPALGHVHALGFSKGDELQEHESVILDVHRSALDVSQRSSTNLLLVPDRSVLENIWRSMIGSLLRNEATWATFVISEDLIEQAAIVIRKHLVGDYELFSPAITAWQFLLIYERATGQRSHDLSAHLVVQKAIAKLWEFGQGLEFGWYRRLAALFQGRHLFRRMLPQPNEVFLGHAFQPFGRRVDDYYASAHLQRVFINSRALADAHRRYISEEKAQLFEDVALRILIIFGFTPQRWKRLREMSLNGDTELSKEAIAYWDRRLDEFSFKFKSREHREFELARAKILASLVPLARSDEEQTSRRLWPNFESVIQALETFGVREVWRRTATAEGIRIVGERNLGVASEVIAARTSDIVENIATDFSDAAMESFEEIQSQFRSTLGWSPLTSDQNTIDSSGALQRSRDDGAWSAPPLVEESNMAQENADRQSVLSELEEGTQLILQQNPDVLRKFSDTFCYRAKFAELPEAEPNAKGMEAVLSSLLRISPPQKYLAEYTAAKDCTRPSGRKLSRLSKFKDEIVSATVGLSSDSPKSLELFKRNLKQKKVSVDQALGALMLMYVASRDSYPY
jgi:hypothetical protein